MPVRAGAGAGEGAGPESIRRNPGRPPQDPYVKNYLIGPLPWVQRSIAGRMPSNPMPAVYPALCPGRDESARHSPRLVPFTRENRLGQASI